MLNLFERNKTLPSVRDLGVKLYRLPYSLDRIPLGVDNVHIDVHLSPQIYNALRKAAFFLMIRYSKTEMFFKEFRKDSCETAKEDLRRVCNDVLLDGINKAKKSSDVQIDYLAQTALVKLFLQEIKAQYKSLVDQLEPMVRIFQLSDKHDQNDVFIIKEKISEVKIHYHQITRFVGKELFEILAEVNNRKLRNMRETHFLSEDILPSYFFTNPLLHTGNPNDDFFLIEEYVLMGQRSEDIDNYKSIKTTIYELLSQLDLAREDLGHLSPKRTDPKLQKDDSFFDPNHDLHDALMMDPDNMDRLLNAFDAREKGEPENQTGQVSSETRRQKTRKQEILLDHFYRRFRQSGLLRQIVADFEMKDVYKKYCPPMTPRQIREFLVDFWTRISMRTQQKRIKALYGEDFSIEPLLQTVQQIKRCSAKEQKQYILMFLKEFSRYHRDLYNFRLLAEAMDSINLVTEEKIILLSRENRTLFEFLLPDEKVKEEKPIANHVIIKADIRGSMAINQTMREKGLNAASYFSLNFFDPISSVLAEYGASKVFIEGDAIILSILENEDDENVNYSVARACGLAVRILQIVRRYNEKNKENNLPALELGIGICYCEGPPSFLFDGDARIMISPAINQADRLSSCDKLLRKIFKSQDDIFNLFVFENEPDDIGETAFEDQTYRYNVNGIELNEEGFNKLNQEIKLQVFYPPEQDKSMKFYAGKVPLLNGSYQRIVIREAAIHRLNPSALDAVGKISKKYYEVCTHHKIYRFVEEPF
ncbi:MAG TPA: hypothetical protein PLT45_10460 [Smithella sp.]|mgnify:FL=1|nr:hypothetical protein [Smithella sp.]